MFFTFLLETVLQNTQNIFILEFFKSETIQPKTELKHLKVKKSKTKENMYVNRHLENKDIC